MEKIKDVAAAKRIADQCIAKFVKGNLVYFNLYVAAESEGSNCYFSPISTSRKDQQKIVFVNDIEKLIRFLLSHPKVEDIRYYEKENMITAVFYDKLEVVEPGL